MLCNNILHVKGSLELRISKLYVPFMHLLNQIKMVYPFEVYLWSTARHAIHLQFDISAYPVEITAVQTMGYT
jgi:hypothetical protein